MRNVDAAIVAHWLARKGRKAALLVWVEARRTDSGVASPLGVWSGPRDFEFNVAGQLRTYIGAGALLKMDPLTSEVGLTVRSISVELSSIDAAIKDKLKAYNLRNAAAEIHVAEFDPETHNLLAAPERVFKGKVEETPMFTPPLNGQVRASLSFVSAAESLTYGVARKVSDESLRARSSGDGFRKYADISGSVETVWGEKRSSVTNSGVIQTALDISRSIWGGR